MYATLDAMNVVGVEGEEEGSTVLAKACEFNLSFYDCAYVWEALQSRKTLVTDDKKLAETAESMSVKTLTSETLIRLCK
ncbi:MAG: type II toxin-antitoxin system VapC family toxin [Candidatus Bathyarchaeia archaeon]